MATSAICMGSAYLATRRAHFLRSTFSSLGSSGSGSGPAGTPRCKSAAVVVIVVDFVALAAAGRTSWAVAAVADTCVAVPDEPLLRRRFLRLLEI